MSCVTFLMLISALVLLIKCDFEKQMKCKHDMDELPCDNINVLGNPSRRDYRNKIFGLNIRSCKG